jgi:thymidylate synthase
MTNEEKYLDLLKTVLDTGLSRPDRTGVGVRSLFGFQTRFDLKSTFPLLTTKKMNLASIVSELLWFIEGSGDERRLAEIRFGKDRNLIESKRTIWTDNAEAPYWLAKAKFDGDLGRVYGVQWRDWQTSDGRSVDQLANLIGGIKRDPFGRRHIISAWNPGELEEMALPPCHVMAQFYVAGGELSCLLYQRSNDLFLGSPYNIASYALFTKMIAQVCGLRAGELIYSQGDTHIYDNHEAAVREQLSRVPRQGPQIYIDPSIKKIEDFRMEHFELIGYDNPYPAIKAAMAV